MSYKRIDERTWMDRISFGERIPIAEFDNCKYISSWYNTEYSDIGNFVRHIWYYIESVFPRGRYGTSFDGTGEFITAMGLHFQGTEKFVIGTNENYDVLDDAFK